jgi:hypothetical protein
MDAVTYPDTNVSEFTMKSVIPLRAPSNAEPLATDFNLKWTPTLITLDSTGKEHYRTVGFLPPEELIPTLLLGIGKTHFELNAFAEAIATFDKIIADYQKSSSAPEAIFFKGVCGYKSTHTAGPLKEAYEKLNAEYPQSEWTKRALPYRLL